MQSRHRKDNLNLSSVWLCSRNDIIANTSVLAAAGLVFLTQSGLPALAVGVILVVALMVSPAAAAYLLTKELHWMMLVGAGLGVFSCMVGMYISYYINTPSGPAIALTLFACFLLALLFSPGQGILTRRRGQSKA